MTADQRLMKIIRQLPPSEAQNRLISLADRDLALSMMYLSDEDREFVLSHIGKNKGERIREELSFQKNIRITYPQYRRAIDHVTESLLSSKNRESLKSYLRPVRSEGKRRP